MQQTDSYYTLNKNMRDFFAKVLPIYVVLCMGSIMSIVSVFFVRVYDHAC